MRAVLDTSVLISALISDRSYPYRAFNLWLDKAFELVTSEYQIEEIKMVSRYDRVAPMLRTHQPGWLVNRLRKRATVMHELPEVDASPDPKDNPILATAIAGQAFYLVSGDKGDLLALGRVQGVQIVTARAFVETIG